MIAAGRIAIAAHEPPFRASAAALALLVQAGVLVPMALWSFAVTPGLRETVFEVVFEVPPQLPEPTPAPALVSDAPPAEHEPPAPPAPVALPLPELEPEPLPVRRAIPEPPRVGPAPPPRPKSRPPIDPPHTAAVAAPDPSSDPPATVWPAVREIETAAGNLPAKPAIGRNDDGSTDDRPPSSEAAYLNNRPPKYPLAARRRGVQGVVLLDVAVDTLGAPVDVLVKLSSGFEPLDRAAVDAVRDWRFLPARKQGMPVAARVEVPIRFHLDEATKR